MESTEYNIYIADLVSKLLKGEISAEDNALLENWKKDSDENMEFFIKLTSHEYLQEIQNKYNLINSEFAWKNINNKLYKEHSSKRSIPINLFKYAAIITLFIFVAALLFYNHQTGKPTVKNNQVLVNNQIHPGGKHAVLILSDGHKVYLGSKTRKLINEDDGTILHNINNTLAYGNSNLKANDVILYNTLVIPRGGEYQLVLSDGTKIWMNSLSELRYPTKFTGSERNVFLKGEAYFEVAKNASMPFIVKTNKAEIMVLGTHFNITAYEDEKDVKTTLIEGSVKIKSQTASRLLKPGEQAVLNNDGQLNINKDINVGEAIAWKNGLFEFKGSDIEQIMRKASRWYDIKVIYQGAMPDTKFTGRISRDVDISGLMDILRFEGVNLKIDGKNIIIKK